MHIYLATGLSASALPQDEDEFIEIEQVPAAQAYEMAYAGKIRDAKTLAALFLARPRLIP
jgi:ADP-ribose pyrophosphatase